MPTGRPSKYTPELTDAICERLANGESLKSICEADDMPCQASVFNWLSANPEFLEKYTRAREAQADVLADEILNIADDGTNDWMERQDDKGGQAWALNGEHIQRSRLRVEARKWVASKLKPKKYGDRVVHEGDETNPVRIVNTIELVGISAGQAKPKG